MFFENLFLRRLCALQYFIPLLVYTTPCDALYLRPGNQGTNATEDAAALEAQRLLQKCIDDLSSCATDLEDFSLSSNTVDLVAQHVAELKTFLQNQDSSPTNEINETGGDAPADLPARDERSPGAPPDCAYPGNPHRAQEQSVCDESNSGEFPKECHADSNPREDAGERADSNPREDAGERPDSNPPEVAPARARMSDEDTKDMMEKDPEDAKRISARADRQHAVGTTTEPADESQRRAQERRGPVAAEHLPGQGAPCPAQTPSAARPPSLDPGSVAIGAGPIISAEANERSQMNKDRQEDSTPHQKRSDQVDRMLQPLWNSSNLPQLLRSLGIETSDSSILQGLEDLQNFLGSMQEFSHEEKALSKCFDSMESLLSKVDAEDASAFIQSLGEFTESVEAFESSQQHSRAAPQAAKFRHILDKKISDHFSFRLRKSSEVIREIFREYSVERDLPLQRLKDVLSHNHLFLQLAVRTTVETTDTTFTHEDGETGTISPVHVHSQAVGPQKGEMEDKASVILQNELSQPDLFIPSTQDSDVKAPVSITEPNISTHIAKSPGSSAVTMSAEDIQKIASATTAWNSGQEEIQAGFEAVEKVFSQRPTRSSLETLNDGIAEVRKVRESLNELRPHIQSLAVDALPECFQTLSKYSEQLKRLRAEKVDAAAESSGGGDEEVQVFLHKSSDEKRTIILNLMDEIDESLEILHDEASQKLENAQKLKEIDPSGSPSGGCERKTIIVVALSVGRR